MKYRTFLEVERREPHSSCLIRLREDGSGMETDCVPFESLVEGTPSFWFETESLEGEPYIRIPVELIE